MDTDGALIEWSARGRLHRARAAADQRQERTRKDTGRQQRLQPRPLRISQVMSFQPVLIHEAIKAKVAHKIYETPPRSRCLRRPARSLNPGTDKLVAPALVRLVPDIRLRQAADGQVPQQRCRGLGTSARSRSVSGRGCWCSSHER